MRFSTLLPMLLLAYVVSAGCGGSTRQSLVNVTGKVTLDGKPLDGAQVFFKRVVEGDGKSKRPSRATTNAQGEFNPGTYSQGDGIATGKYQVAVIKTEYAEKLPESFNGENPAATPVKMRWLVPKVYSDMETSGLTVEITSSGMDPPELKLETGGAAPVVESTAPTRRANDP